MTHITTQVPVRALNGPRGAEPFAAIALAALDLGRSAGNALLGGVLTHPLLTHFGLDASHKSGTGSGSNGHKG